MGEVKGHMGNSTSTSKTRQCLAYLLIPCAVIASEKPQATDSIIPGSLIVDARSVSDAVRMDRSQSSSGARSQCFEEAEGGLGAASAAGPAKTDRIGALVGKLKQRAETVANPGTRTTVMSCSEERRSGFVPQQGIQHYSPLLQTNAMYLSILANSASGIAPGPALQVVRTVASNTCVQSMQLPALPWKVYPGVLTPTISSLDGEEQAVSVIDQECYHKTFPTTPIPPHVKILSVHEYFDRIVQSRAARARAAGYAPYAGTYTDDYARLKNARN